MEENGIEEPLLKMEIWEVFNHRWGDLMDFGY